MNMVAFLMTWVFKRFRCSATPQLPPVVPHLIALPPEVLLLIAETRRQNRQDRMEELVAMYVGDTFEYREGDAVYSTVQSYQWAVGQFGISWSGGVHFECISPEELLTRLLMDGREEPDLMELIAMVAEEENDEEILDWWLACSLLCRK
jgi:hypothetical protein